MGNVVFGVTPSNPPPSLASNLLSDIVGTAEFELDAMDTDSYPGSGDTIASLISSPNSGAAQSDYLFHLGSGGSPGTNLPTFDTDKFTVDGGDFFQNVNALSTFIKSSIRTNAANPRTLFVVMRTAASFSTNRGIFGNSNRGSDSGFLLNVTSGGALNFHTRYSGSTNPNALTTLSASTWYFIAVKWQSSDDTLQYAVNASTFTDVAGYSATGSTADVADNGMNIFSESDGTNIMTSGAEFRTCAMMGGLASDSELANYKSALETRHSTSY